MTALFGVLRLSILPFLLHYSHTNEMDETMSSSSDYHDDDTLLKAKVKYMASTNDGSMTATYYASEAGVDQAKEHDGQFRFHTVDIRNGRNHQQSSSVDREGFQFIRQNTSSAVKDFYNDEEVTEVFYKEVKEILLQNVPGATRIEIFDHTRRASTSTLRQQLHCREPSAIIHNDYTANSAKKRLFDMLPDQAEELSKRRFAIVNLWRSIAGTVESAPLAFCDSTSINVRRDLMSVQRVSKDRIGEIQMALYNPQHQWYYFPLMTNDEVLVFKTFDSSESVNQFTLHTALDSAIGEDSSARPRQSIEIRAFIFFD